MSLDQGPLEHSTWRKLKSLGLLRKTRGHRAGYWSKPSSTTNLIKSVNSRYLAACDLHRPTYNLNNYSARHGQMTRNNNNLVTIKRSPFQPILLGSNAVNFSLLNARSVRNKTLALKDHVVDRDIDIFALTETWLSPTQDEPIISDLCPTGYTFSCTSRGSRGGGVAVLHKKSLKFKKQSIIKHRFKSFEFIDVLLSRKTNLTLRLVVVYRPPPSKSNGGTLALFFEEFPKLLEQLITTSGSLLIVGDFNFHVDKPTDTTAQRFVQLLHTFDLAQHITSPTHKNGHILDLVITRSDELCADRFIVTDLSLSDHYAVNCVLSLRKPPLEKKEISYRKLKHIDIQQFRDDIIQLPVVAANDNAVDVADLVDSYNNELTDLLDKYAPLKTSCFTLRPSSPWYSENIKVEKQRRRRLERLWRKSGLTVHKDMFAEQCRVVNMCVHDSKMTYYSTLINNNQSNPKALFSTVDKLLHRKPEKKLPSSDCSTSLANKFAEFFHDKIVNISSNLQARRADTADLFSDTNNCQSELCEFQQITVDDFTSLVCSPTIKTCVLDPIPSSIMKEISDVLYPVLTRIVNLSLERSEVPCSLKKAVVYPLLKKPSLDHEVLLNYRPISNLSFISKCCGFSTQRILE